MVRNSTIGASLLAVAAATILVISGCNEHSENTTAESRKQTTTSEPKESPLKKAEDHGHKPGVHGGIMVEIGRDNYHAEAVFEKGGLLKVFMLGKDEAKIVDVESQTLKAYVKQEAAAESTEIELQPTPRAGDKAGRTSQFIGKIPSDLVGKPLTVTVPIIVIDGERFRFGFTSIPEKHEQNAQMPSAASLDEEKELYLKPGGAYTAADIIANGNVTASQKFKGVLARHDLKPKIGEKICPITLTKANSNFTWIVGGKSYEFCCPPCVDEFVAAAKSNPELIKSPEEFVKKK